MTVVGAVVHDVLLLCPSQQQYTVHLIQGRISLICCGVSGVRQSLQDGETEIKDQQQALTLLHAAKEEEEQSLRRCV